MSQPIPTKAKDRLVSSIALVLCFVLVGIAPAGARAGGHDCDGPPPPPAAAAGYTALLFCDDFSSIASIDMDAAGCPSDNRGPCAATPRAGYKWFRAGKPFNWEATPKHAIAVADGILTITGNSANMGLLSTYWRAGGGFGGFSVANEGAYFEAAVAFETPPRNWLAEARMWRLPGQPARRWRSGWPSFWTMDTCHLYFGTCSPFLELDFFEYLSYAIAGPDTYSGAIHRWLNLRLLDIPCGKAEGVPKCHQKEQSNVWSRLKTGFTGERGIRQNNIIEVPRNTDWSAFNVAGMLLKHGDGLYYFFNNQAYNRNAYADFPWMSIADRGDYPVILGSHGWPMRVDWVRVWGTPRR